jgi:hypothetical protein
MPSAGARLGETANDYLIHLRFGRTGVLPTYEKPEARERLAKLHGPLGSDRNVTDVEILRVDAAGERGTVIAQLSWYSPSDLMLRSSTVEQKWLKTTTGTWLVEDESVVAGDTNFYASATGTGGAPERAPASKELGKGAHFPTVRLGN